MNIVTKVEYKYKEGNPLPVETNIVEQKEFDIIKEVKEITNTLSKKYNKQIKISNIKFNISNAGVSDSIDVALDLTQSGYFRELAE